MQRRLLMFALVTSSFLKKYVNWLVIAATKAQDKTTW